MANKKLSEQTEITSADSTDIIHVVVDPGGTPTSYKIQKDNFLKDCVSQDESPSLSADLDAQGNYAVDLQNFPDMLAGQGPGYWFDGTDVSKITLTGSSVFMVGTSDFTTITHFKSELSENSVKTLFDFWKSDGQRFRLRFSNATNNVIDSTLKGLSGSAQNICISQIGEDEKNHVISQIFDRSETDGHKIYLDSKEETYSSQPDLTTLVNDNIQPDQIIYLGRGLESNYGFVGNIHSLLFFNLALPDAERIAIENGAPIPYKYIGASQIEQLSNYDFSGTWTGNLPDGWLQVGTVDANSYLTADDANDRLGIYTDNTDLIGVYQSGLTVGKQYRYTISIHSITGSLSIFTDSVIESFTSSGIYTGTFTATTTVFQLIRTTGLNLDCYINYASIIQIGCVLDLNPSGIGHNTWQDVSGNQLHGVVSGALPINTPANHSEKYIDLTVTGNTSFTLPQGYQIKSILAIETAGNALTGGLDVGLTTNGTEIVSGEAIGANAIVPCTLIASGTVGGTFTTADDTIYISDGDDDGNWNSASLEIRVVMDRIENI